MTSNEAYSLAISDIPNWDAVRCFEHESVFVFHMLPIGYRKSESEVFDCMRSVNKTTKEVRSFQPFHLPIEEYKSGKEIFDFKMKNNELTHWGILGMKWGVRRFQNKDGTLTAEGKKRYDDDDSDSGRSKRESTKPASKNNVKDMSDDEIKNEIARMRLEKDYRDLLEGERKVSELAKSKNASLGSRFVRTVWNDMIVPGSVDVGKQLFKSIMVKTVNEKVVDKWGDEYKLATNNKKK